MSEESQKLYSISYDKEKDILFLKWHLSSITMNDEDFYLSQKDYQSHIIKNKPVNTLIDIREMKFIVRPSLQEKIAQEHFPEAIAAGLRRVAILNTSDFVNKIWAEQMMEEDESGIFKTRYFDNEKDAINWFTS